MSNIFLSNLFKNRVIICLITCCLLIEYNLFVSLFSGRSNGAMKIDIARRSMIILVILALVGYHRLPAVIQQVFEIIVYIFTIFTVSVFFIFQLYK
jgi:hypothetical protein